MSILRDIARVLTGKDRHHPNVGKKFRSDYLETTITVTAYNHDWEWFFTSEGSTQEMQAGTPLGYFIKNGLEVKK